MCYIDGWIEIYFHDCNHSYEQVLLPGYNGADSLSEITYMCVYIYSNNIYQAEVPNFFHFFWVSGHNIGQRQRQS